MTQQVTFLGTGTSSGVPVPGCKCRVCTSEDSRNSRLRCSVLFSTPAGTVLIDTGPDLRAQSIRACLERLDAVLYTHTHADHVFGFDDLRSFNFVMQKPIPVYASSDSAEILERMFSYAFFPDPDYLGAAPPKLELHRIEPFSETLLIGESFIAIPIVHGTAQVFGYRVRNFAYLTDCNSIPEESIEHLQSLDVLVLDGLRYRPHPTHFNFDQAIEIAERLRPKQTLLTHISHEADHAETNRYLAEHSEVPIELAYDGLKLEFN